MKHRTPPSGARLAGLMLGLLLTLLPALAAAVTLKIATLLPDGTSWMQAMRDGAAEVESRTQGRVELRFYPGGVMGNEQSVLRKIRVGQLQGGAFSGGGMRLVYPDSQALGLPFLYRSYAEVDAVRARVDPQIIAGMRERGYVSYGIGEAGFAYLMSKQPVRQIEDLQGRKVWTPEGDRISLAGFEAVGVAPIQLPITDVLTALQTGVIDTLGSTPTAAIALQWHTRLSYLTDLPLLYTYGTFLIQEKALKRVSKQDREILHEVLERRLREIERQTREDNRKALTVLEQQGIQILAPSAAEMADWQQAVVAATDRLATEGVFSQQILDLLRQTLREFRAQ